MAISRSCNNMGLKRKPITKYNPQANSVLERIHQVLGNQFRTFELEKRELDDHEPFEPFLTAVAYAVRTTYHTTLQATPAQLVFGRDMMLPIKFQADWAAIAQRKQDVINYSNKKENKKRIRHEYKVGDMVLYEPPKLKGKLQAPRQGPFQVTKVHDNGTVTIRKGTAIEERLNIRLLYPYFERNP